MPGTRSSLRLSQRKERAFELFGRGWTAVDVASELDVSEDTAQRYKREWRDRIELQARENPAMLIEVLQNTIQALYENDQIRKRLWEEYERASEGTHIECDECGNILNLPSSAYNTRRQLLNSIMEAQNQRAKLYGLFGVKAEFFSQVQKIKALQDALLEFMRQELCATDRGKLDDWLQRNVGDMPRDVPVVPAGLLVESTEN